MRTRGDRAFWRPPIWKWAVFLALVAFSAFLILHKPTPQLAKVELLPFTDSPPAWDGSYPYLVITPADGSAAQRFNNSISLVKPSLRHDSPINQFAVDLHTGRFILRQTDLFVPDIMPLALTRTYATWDPSSHAFGTGANHPYDICPTGTRFPYTYQNLNLEDGYQVYMPRISKGTGYADAVFRHAQTASEFYGAQNAWNGNGWTLTLRDGRKILFPEAYFARNFAQGGPIEMRDSDAHSVHLKRNQVRNLEELRSPAGHTITFQYDTADRIIEAHDDTGHIRKYAYDASGHLQIVSNGSRVLYRLEYQRLLNQPGFDPWLLTAILDGDWNVILRNKFQWGRVSEQRLADGEVFRYDYRFDSSKRNVFQCTVVLPSGEKQTFSFHDKIPIQPK